MNLRSRIRNRPLRIPVQRNLPYYTWNRSFGAEVLFLSYSGEGLFVADHFSAGYFGANQFSAFFFDDCLFFAPIFIVAKEIHCIQNLTEASNVGSSKKRVTL